MPRDISIVKENIQAMLSQGAPQSDVNQYISEEGYSPEQLNQKQSSGASGSFQPEPMKPF